MNSETLTTRSDRRLPYAIIAAMVVISVFVFRFEGRLWWCKCQRPTIFNTDAWGPHNSQHLFDPYSLTHIEHGMLLFGFFALVCPQLASRWRFVLTTAVECGWEIVENSPWVIDRYRNATAAQGYTGDTVVNALGDVLSCIFGYWLAQRIGLWWSVAVIVTFEFLLLLWIRDNLALNVLQLIMPIEAISTWQGGH